MEEKGLNFEIATFHPGKRGSRGAGCWAAFLRVNVAMGAVNHFPRRQLQLKLPVQNERDGAPRIITLVLAQELPMPTTTLPRRAATWSRRVVIENSAFTDEFRAGDAHL
jgi:hypothetical protein